MKIRKNTQPSLMNLKCAGRKAIHDRAIRHTERPKFKNARSLHLTIKVRENKADIKSIKLLKALHHAIKRARLMKLKIIHYTLEYNHVHLLVEADTHHALHRGMQAFGISFSKAINKTKRLKGTVYKHRYHFRQICSSRELKNVLHYIFHNGIKHGRTSSLIDPFNSLMAEKNLHHIYKKKCIQADIDKSDHLMKLKSHLTETLDEGVLFFRGLPYLKT